TRCDLVLKLASIAPPDRAWFARLETVLNCIKNEICAERNRLVHDVWVGMEGNPVQLDERAFLKAAQSHQPKTLTAPKQPERSLPSMWDLVRRIQTANGELVQLMIDYMRWRRTGCI